MHDNSTQRRITRRAAQALLLAALVAPALVVAAAHISLIVDVARAPSTWGADALVPLPPELTSDFGPAYADLYEWRRRAIVQNALFLSLSLLHIAVSLTTIVFHGIHNVWPVLVRQCVESRGRPACELCASLWSLLAQVLINTAALARSGHTLANTGVSLAVVVAAMTGRRVFRGALGLGWASWGVSALGAAAAVILGSLVQLRIATGGCSSLFDNPDFADEVTAAILGQTVDAMGLPRNAVLLSDEETIAAVQHTRLIVGRGYVERLGSTENIAEMVCLVAREIKRFQQYRWLLLALAARVLRVVLALSLPWIALLPLAPVQDAMDACGVRRVPHPSAGGILLSPLVDVSVRYLYLLAGSAILRSQETALDEYACGCGCGLPVARALRRAGWTADNADASPFSSLVCATPSASRRILVLQDCESDWQVKVCFRSNDSHLPKVKDRREGK